MDYKELMHWRRKYVELEAENQRLRDRIDLAENRYVELLAENQRLRGLLRLMIVNTEYCPICRHVLFEGDGPHAQDCELAKELSDE
jgi:hypothetical protein